MTRILNLQLQASIDSEKGFMITSGYSSHTINQYRSLDSTCAVDSNGEVDRCSDTNNLPSDDVATVARKLLTSRDLQPEEIDRSPEDNGALELSSQLHGIDWVVDTDMLACIYQDLFGVRIDTIVFLSNDIIKYMNNC